MNSRQWAKRNRAAAGMDEVKLEGVQQLLAESAARKAALEANAATARQVVYLRVLGLNVPPGLTKSEAGQLITEVKARRADGYLGYGEDHGDDAVRPHEYEASSNNEIY